MATSVEQNDPGSPGAAAFALTHWSVVLAAGRNDSTQAGEALEKPCRTYWFPIYAFVRRQGHSHRVNIGRTEAQAQGLAGRIGNRADND
jgi:hypothetical protein